MLGCQRRKGGSRIDVADRFSDSRQNLRLSAVVGRTVHVGPPAFHAAKRGEAPTAVGGDGAAERFRREGTQGGWVPVRNA
jgi:hypothetical protein